LRRRSLRNRLSLIHAGLAGLAMVAVLAAVWTVARHDLIGNLDGEARAAARALARDVRGRPAGPALPASIVLPAQRIEADEHLAVRDRGRVIAGDPTARRLAALLPSAPSGRPWTGMLSVGDTDFRVATEPAGRGRTAMGALAFEGALEASGSLLDAVLLVGALGVLLTTLTARWAVRRALRPLDDIGRTAALVAPDSLGHRTGAAPRDEIGEVGAAVDRMLHRLEEAFGAQRSFLQDASHELRTPLTIARGHLEVLAGEPEPDPEELRATLDLVLDELETMGRLVDALLELAWASEPGRLRPEPLRAAELLERSARDFRVLARREWRVATTADAVMCDGRAVQQILGNLVRNAIRHTADGTPIELASRRVNGMVELSVRDYGPGVDPALGDALFDRFAHAGDGGFGLGLAIARTLAERQGGALRHEAPASGGARFVLSLPAAPRAAGRAASAAPE
jgi:signal transduction histidine kinase